MSLAWLPESSEKLNTEELVHMQKNLLISICGLKSCQLLHSTHGTGTTGSLQGPGEPCAQCRRGASSLVPTILAAATVLRSQRPRLCIIQMETFLDVLCTSTPAWFYHLCFRGESIFMLVATPTEAALVRKKKASVKVFSNINCTFIMKSNCYHTVLDPA